MLLEFYFTFLQLLAGDVADIASVRLVTIQIVVLLSEAAERIQHDTRYNISKEQAEEDGIDGIINKPLNLKLFHGLSDGARDVQCH